MVHSNKSAKNRLLFMLSLTTSFFVIEITVGYITNSMALVADSFHMLSDVVALVIAYVSVRMSPKKWSKNTFGWARAEVLGALVNAVFLCALCFSILVESIKRFYDIEIIHDPLLILIVGFAGLLVNVIGLFIFKDAAHGHSHGGHGHSHGVGNGHHHLSNQDDAFNHHTDPPSSRETTPHPPSPSPEPRDENKKKKKKQQPSSQQMNMKGVFLHVLADALGSVIVCISASIILFTEWPIKDYVDPFLSLLMVCLIMYSTWPLLVESAMILLQTVPTHIQVDSLQRKLLQEIDGVLAVHEFHVWQLAGDRIIASAHIRCHNLHDYMQIAEKVKEFFHNAGIHSTTIQPEFIDLENEYHKENEASCVLDCPQNTSCVAQTCCGPQKDSKSSPKLVTANGVYRAAGNGSVNSTPSVLRRSTAACRNSTVDGDVVLSSVDIDNGTHSTSAFEVNNKDSVV
ncbi:zinc transporter 1-like protein [Dinothrombium tinctorium]|uniref:Zinc transporter 1-like protein n=1 Tax=Dinothrombium tinctorium TaxID=1965070 RepID=A0A3S3P491_9ACAR|nr:zinc transporter 1-like protein [Dinothrombium tinctorium]